MSKQNENYVEVDDIEIEIGKQSTWETFIGKNTDFYFHQWGFRDGIVTKETSWNWAAFFLGIFWLGYRKMYHYIFMFLGIFLAMEIFLLLLNVNDAFLQAMNRAVGIGIAVTLGLFGNYFYYLHARRKIQQLQMTKQLNKHTLTKAGGTSGAGVLIAASGLIVFFSCYLWFDSALSSLRIETIEFGYEQANGELIEPSNEFRTDDLIYYSFHFPDEAGPEYAVVIEKVEDNTSFTYDLWKEKVPQERGKFISSLFAPSEEGQYMMKVILDDKIVAEGTFFIISSHHDADDSDSI